MSANGYEDLNNLRFNALLGRLRDDFLAAPKGLRIDCALFFNRPSGVPQAMAKAKPQRKPRSRTTRPSTVEPVVGIIMGSQSDWETMKNAADILKELQVPFEASVVSAHRTPDRLYNYATSAAQRGLKVIIAGAGGAAHLPGMAASMTTLPVLGVPVESKSMKGLDSLLSIVQMPGGIPVGTLAIGNAGAKNAGLLAASILALSDAALGQRLATWRARQTNSVPEKPT